MHEALIGILFLKIIENRRKGRWKVTGCKWGGKWRKTMENEENRGLINKKAFEDQLESFLLVQVFANTYGSYSILSLSLILGHLDFSWSTLALEQERKESKKKEESSKEEKESSNYNRIICKYWFTCMISLLDLACMVLHVVIFYLGINFFPGVIVYSA